MPRACRLLIVLLAGASCAYANTYSWTFQEVGLATGQSIGLAMRQQAWPVVFTQSSTFSGGAGAYSLTPAGWVAQTLTTGYPSGSVFKARTSPTGRAVAVWGGNYSVEFAQSSGNGWQRASWGTTSRETPDIAFLPNAKPVIGYSDKNYVNLAAWNGSSWDRAQIGDVRDPATGVTVSLMARQVSVAVESQGNLGVAYGYNNNVTFAWRDPVTSAWYGRLLSTTPLSSTVTDVSLAYGPNDQAGIVTHTTDRNLYYSSFDIQTGSWVTELIASEVQSQRVSLVFDQQGHPAVAYTTGNYNVRFATKIGAGWANYTLPTSVPAYSATDAALAFDADNLPVIAYISTNGRAMLAYDPVLPEPSCLALMLFSAAACLVRPSRVRP